MKKVVLLLVVFGITFSFCSVGVTKEIKLKKYQPSEAVKLAQLTDRQIVILVVAEGCSACSEFKKETLTDDGLQKLLNTHFIFSEIVLGSGSSSGEKKFSFPDGAELDVGDISDFLAFEYVPYSLFLYPDLSGRPLFFWGTVRPQLYIDYLTYFSRWDRTSFSFIDFVKGVSEKESGSFYNYRRELKKISGEDLSSIESSQLGFKVLSSPVGKGGLEGVNEVVLDFESIENAKNYAHEILDRGAAEKVYVVESEK